MKQNQCKTYSVQQDFIFLVLFGVQHIVTETSKPYLIAALQMGVESLQQAPEPRGHVRINKNLNSDLFDCCDH
jgi:hypothetical protein